MRLLFSGLLFLLSFTVSGQGQWITIVTEGSYFQGYKTLSDLDEVTKEVRELTQKGHFVKDLEYGDGKWRLFYENDVTSTEQSWSNSAYFPDSWLEEQKEKKMNITRIAYGQFKWVAFARKQGTIKKQLFNVVYSWDEVISWLKKVWTTEPRYNIEDIAYGDGEWGVLLNYSENEEHQVFTVSETYPNSWIQSKFNDNYNFSAIESDGEKWYVVMTRKKTQKSEKVLPSKAFPSEDIKKEWDKNLRVTQIVYHIDQESEDFAEYVRSGNEAMEKGKYSEAITKYFGAASIDPYNSAVWNQMAWARYKLGDCQKGLEEASASLKIEENHYNLHTMGMLLVCLNRKNEALTYLNKSIDAHLKSAGEFKEATYYLDRAELRYSLKDNKGALEDLKKAESIEPYNKVVTIRVEDLRAKMN